MPQPRLWACSMPETAATTTSIPHEGDIAAALESRAPEFDWERCLGGNARRSDWVACTLGLAHRLLGASLENTPVVDRARTLPTWLVSTVLRQWGEGRMMHEQMLHSLGHPLAWLAELPRQRGNVRALLCFPHQLTDSILPGQSIRRAAE